MAAFEFQLPDVGEGVHEGEIVAWHVKPGDAVTEDQPMVEVMTDKATVTIGAPKAGTVSELRFGVGDTARVGEVLVVLDVGEGAAPHAAPEVEAPDPSATEDRAASAVGDISDRLPGTDAYPAERTTGQTRVPTDDADAYFEAKPLATPATRKLARDLEVDLRRVRPAREDGRVTKDDVRRHAEGAATAAAARPPAPPEPAGPAASEPPADRRVPFRGVRRQIARHLQEAVRTAAHFTFVEECDVGRLLALRDRLAPQAEERGVELTLLPFVVKAVVEALERHPTLNAYLDEEAGELVLRGEHHIGIAAATEAGLLVPVLRHADHRSILDLAREIHRLAEGARAGTLSREELTGSTFTITSLGKLGGLHATPILNHPEVGILGVHRIRERPVVRDGEIVVGQVMHLSLSFDHRVVDGHEGAAFAYDVIGYLEQPDRLFLEMA